MNLSDIQWDQVGVGVAALIALIVIVRIMRSQTDRLLTHTEDTNERVLNFFGNHMSENVRQSADTAVALRELTGAVRELRDEVRTSREANQQ